MYYGLLSGILWAVDTVILGVALGMSPYVDSAQASFASAFCCSYSSSHDGT